MTARHVSAGIPRLSVALRTLDEEWKAFAPIDVLDPALREEEVRMVLREEEAVLKDERPTRDRQRGSER
jgi:hypothetical protein